MTDSHESSTSGSKASSKMPEGFVRVTSIDDVPLGSFKPFEVGYDQILIVHTDDGFFAIANECTHDSGTISNGRLFRNQVICPRHGARFDVRTGEVLSPPAIVPLDTYEVRIDGSDLYVMID